MPGNIFKPIVVAQLLISGCAIVFGACIPHEVAQAQQSAPTSSAPAPGPAPTMPTRSPTLNPSNPTTAQQPSYRSLLPSTPITTPSTPGTSSTAPSSARRAASSADTATPANDEGAATTVHSGRRVSKTRAIHHHLYRPALVTYGCSHLGCVRTYAWAFPCQYFSRYCGPVAVYDWGD